MTATVTSELAVRVWAALATVMDPELDEPITDLGFVRSHDVHDDDVEVHLRLPTSFCAPNFGYLMASDAQDALRAIPGVGQVRVYLDDHHDSELINRGLATMAGYVGTFGPEAEDSLDELRLTFQRKAHVAAMERACSKLLAESELEVGDLHAVTLADLPESREKTALIRRRHDIGLAISPGSPVMVDDTGQPVPQDAVPVKLRFAKTVRIAIDGNAHFCRGLLRTRYPDSAADQAPRADG
jgi:metal-sulfur cluster biosynthetic enzyme